MYTTQARVEAYLNRELTSNEAVLIDDIISSISSFIQAYTHRNWLPVDDTDGAGEPTTRTYDGNGSKELFIDDYTEIVGINILDSYGNTSIGLDDDIDWIEYPLGDTVFESLRLRSYHYPVGAGNVQITAVWSSGAVPADVVMACTALVANYITNAGDTTGTFKRENIEGYSYELMDSSTTEKQRDKILESLDRHIKIIL